MKLLYSILILGLLISCDDNPTPIDTPIDTFEAGANVGSIQNKALDEASGIIASYTNPGMLWVHNDSGDSNRIFLIDNKGQGTKEFYLEGATNRDWEDIAITKFDDGNYLYIADIGDNNAQYPSCTIYRVLEPNTSSQTVQASSKITLTGVKAINFVYPDGPRDAECMMIDHATKDIYILSKRENKQRLYRLKYPQSYTQTTTAEFVEEVSFSTAINQLFYITAGDISPDNQEILVRNYGQIFHWRRKTGETLPQVLLRPASLTNYNYDASKEAQGEGICFSLDAKGYFTIGETTDYNLPVNLYWYARQTK
ncbi:hypothetical protein [Flectobacillus major]|uniref:hypothetical protein n=1 Tax=Flectobacillus major TaxID=103 RepID=UPI00040669EE|nr:hypothetical protein [Flectobacillus major]